MFDLGPGEKVSNGGATTIASTSKLCGEGGLVKGWGQLFS